MTVKELREKLKNIPDNYMVLIPYEGRLTVATSVTVGFNELDCAVIIDNYTDDEDNDE